MNAEVLQARPMRQGNEEFGVALGVQLRMMRPMRAMWFYDDA